MSEILQSVFQRFTSDGHSLSEEALTKEPKISAFDKWIKTVQKTFKKIRKSTLFGHERLNDFAPSDRQAYKYRDKTFVVLPAKKHPGLSYFILEESKEPIQWPPKGNEDLENYRKGKYEGRKWTRGRPYSVEQNTVYLTPTNFPRVSYLDLDEFSMNIANFCPEISKAKDIYSWRYLQEHPFIECPHYFHAHYQKPVDEVIDNSVIIYYSDVHRMLTVEFEEGTWVDLWNKWHPKRFRRFMIHQVNHKSEDFLLVSSSLISLLRRHRCSPELIVECYKNICTNRDPRDFLTKMPNSYVATFLKNSIKLNIGSPMFGGHEAWLVDENLVEHAFMKGCLKRLLMLFQYRCPSVFVPSCLLVYFDEQDTRDIYWPREKPVDGGEKFTSYNSTEYIALVMLFLFRFFPMAKARNEILTWSVRLLWRSIPTPFIPVSDINDFIKVQKLSRRDNAAWKKNIDLLPKDFANEYSPRSLFHLSRCAIRLLWSAPDDIDCLPLPTEIKIYLKLLK